MSLLSEGALSHLGKVRPFLAWIIYTLTLFLWHLPKFYGAALKNEWIHDLQHIMFFVTAYYFWKVIFDPFRKKMTGIVAILYPFVASIHGILLGAFMTFSPKVWYQHYAQTAPLYGFTALEDQQIAGLIMWMPAGITYILASLFLVYRSISWRESAPYAENRPS
jgi:cytochrome c oxidase assembly factor CtaG